jgi:hypothetical protein
MGYTMCIAMFNYIIYMLLQKYLFKSLWKIWVAYMFQSRSWKMLVTFFYFWMKGNPYLG